MTLYALGEHSPDIHPDTWVAPDANLIGKVILEEGASVWFGATIRADHEIIRIGAGSNVQENTVMHVDKGFPLQIGTNCTIGHKVMLHGCNIGNATLIGMGSIILNGARIGNNCLIGAGALITEGAVIPDGTLVLGAPGKVVRELAPHAVKILEESARHYQSNMRRYRNELKVIT